MTTTSNVLSQMGVGSGIDVQALVSSLVSSSAAPLTALQNKAAGMQSEISVYGQVSSSYSQLQTAIDGLRAPAAQNSLLGLSINTSTAAVANAAVNGTVAAGSYSLNVATMAKGQQLVSSSSVADSSAAIGGGSLTVQLGKITGGSLSGTPGTYSGASFAPAGSAVTFNIKADSSLSDIRDAINEANAGVAASLIFDGSNYRLALSSTGVGASSSISLSATGDAGLAALMGQDPEGTQNFQQSQAASDLTATLNGIAITSASNTLDKTVSGLTITAYGVGAATLTVAQNAGAAASAVGAFVTAWNGLNAQIRALTSYDPATKSAGPLLGDPLAGAAFNSLTTATFGSTGNGRSNYSTLASLGITIDSKGAASIDQAKLGAALKASPTALANIFSTAKGDVLKASSNFVGTMIGKGGIAGRTSSLNDQLKANATQQQAWVDRLGQIRKNLTAQYTALDSSVAKFQSISSFLGNQIAQLNKS